MTKKEFLLNTLSLIENMGFKLKSRWNLIRTVMGQSISASSRFQQLTLKNLNMYSFKYPHIRIQFAKGNIVLKFANMVGDMQTNHFLKSRLLKSIV